MKVLQTEMKVLAVSFDLVLKAITSVVSCLITHCHKKELNFVLTLLSVSCLFHVHIEIVYSLCDNKICLKLKQS